MSIFIRATSLFLPLQFLRLRSRLLTADYRQISHIANALGDRSNSHIHHIIVNYFNRLCTKTMSISQPVKRYATNWNRLHCCFIHFQSFSRDGFHAHNKNNKFTVQSLVVYKYNTYFRKKPPSFCISFRLNLVSTGCMCMGMSVCVCVFLYACVLIWACKPMLKL